MGHSATATPGKSTSTYYRGTLVPNGKWNRGPWLIIDGNTAVDISNDVFEIFKREDGNPAWYSDGPEHVRFSAGKSLKSVNYEIKGGVSGIPKLVPKKGFGTILFMLRLEEALRFFLVGRVVDVTIRLGSGFSEFYLEADDQQHQHEKNADGIYPIPEQTVRTLCHKKDGRRCIFLTERPGEAPICEKFSNVGGERLSGLYSKEPNNIHIGGCYLFDPHWAENNRTRVSYE